MCEGYLENPQERSGGTLGAGLRKFLLGVVAKIDLNGK